MATRDFKASLDDEGDIFTRSGGVPVGISRAALAADPAFTGVFPASSDAVLYVSLSGDNTDGRSWGRAFSSIAAAMAALPASGGLIEVGAGSFDLGSAAVGLALDPTKSVHIRGRGRLTTVLTYPGTGAAVKLDGTATDPNDWGSLQSLQIRCTGAGAAKGFHLVHAHRGFLHDVYLLGNSYAASSIGVYCDNAFGNYAYQSVVAGFDRGIDLDGTNHDFTIHDVNIGADEICVRVKDSKDVRIKGGQHSGTGATIGHAIVATAAGANGCAGLEIQEVHYEGNGLDLALGRTADGSDTAVLNPVIATPFPSGATIDRASHPLLLNPRIGLGTGTPALTFTANCSYPLVIGLALAAGATLSDSSGTPTIIGDVNGRVGIGTMSPASAFHVEGDALIKNNSALRWKDSGGTSRRIGLLTSGNAVMFGDIDNAMAAANLIMSAGGSGTIQGNVNGTLILFANASTLQAVNAHLQVTTVGFGLKVKEGTNATMGVATMVAGAVTVSTTKVTANSRILLTVQSLGTVAVPQPIAVTARTAATSFTITSADGTDTSVVAWQIVEPA